MKRMMLCIAVVLAWTAVSVAQNEPTVISDNTSTAASSAGKSTPTFSERNGRYKLRPGDTFDLTFEFTPEFNQTLAVQPDGFITLRNAGDLDVNGRTVPEATEMIRAAYGHILTNPHIYLELKDFEKPYFVADGQLNKPGKYDLRGDTTVVQAVAIAGGFTKEAKHSQVVLFRRVDDKWMEAKLLNVKEMENKRDLSEDLHLRPGDMIFVPKNRISKIQQFIPNYGFSVIPGF